MTTTDPAAPTHMMLSFALSYARMGWHVFPVYETDGPTCACDRGPTCGNAGKHPRTQHGCKDATTDEKQIRAWWSRWPQANIGIDLGKSRLIVVDVDPRNSGETPEGLSATVTAKTGGGGWHYYFRSPEGQDYRTGKFAPGVDLKASGGYVVAPPSAHKSGQGYVWEVSSDPSEVPIPEAPPAVLAKMQPVSAPSGDMGHPFHGFIGAAFKAAGMVDGIVAGGKALVVCPWEDEHTSGVRFDSSTVVWGPAPGKARGWFHCSHSHCANRTQQEVLDWLPEYAKQAAAPFDPPTHEDPDAWRSRLIWSPPRKDGSRKMAKCEHNVSTILTGSLAWRGRIQWDEFAQRLLWSEPTVKDASAGLSAPTTGEVRDDHTLIAQEWIGKDRDGVLMSPAMLWSGMVAAGRRQSVHPLQDYLRSLRWDETPRIDTWLSTYLGAEATELHRQLGRYWLIGAVARAMSPGCQLDTMLVLEGAQGIGKSKAARILGGEWYCGTLGDITSREAVERLQGKWIIEVDELASFKGKAAERVKAFVSQVEDTYRPSYGRTALTFRRSCAFIGTTNSDDYANDPTGARRFWPVSVTRGNWDALQRDRNQIWAEAFQAFQGGATWWMDTQPEALQEAQEARQEVDPWEDSVRGVLANRDLPVRLEDVFGALGIPVERRDMQAARRLGAILRRIGFQKRTTRISGEQTAKYWHRKSAVNAVSHM